MPGSIVTVLSGISLFSVAVMMVEVSASVAPLENATVAHILIHAAKHPALTIATHGPRAAAPRQWDKTIQSDPIVVSTLHEAAAAAAKLASSPPHPSPIVIELAAGLHHLPSPLRLHGAAHSHTVWRGPRVGSGSPSAVISGGVPVTGWVESKASECNKRALHHMIL